ncbi:probable thionin-2.3 isoform X2 [Arabidopsis lyrata subsp. lyrata]|uniref:probable thionin-2.3 isoform X2 n=1 Tax=Arabidopsis lyrata subsp. lyrata TaxID=81972 RepID=UPI000A29A3FE|nr:probable thionin-2.3 isoform X2 [Arabidopsis lyrata subsp. lyrata]|eukprot:XP_020886275.1 probable thionin-2.3 isoform X2 [Arabidopsis lyrata subsp. lyrata]
MEGKTVIFSVLVMGLVIWQIQVDAQEQRTCCPSQSSREEFEDCISQGNLHTVCGAGSGCLESYVGFCPSQYPYGSLTNSDTSGKVNEAVERCSKTCSTICTKGSKTAVETV